MSQTTWNPTKESLLRDYYPNASWETMEAVLDMPAQAIKEKAQELRLHRKHHADNGAKPSMALPPQINVFHLPEYRGNEMREFRGGRDPWTPTGCRAWWAAAVSTPNGRPHEPPQAHRHPLRRV